MRHKGVSALLWGDPEVHEYNMVEFLHMGLINLIRLEKYDCYINI
jgi:hypothetical protein